MRPEFSSEFQTLNDACEVANSEEIDPFLCAVMFTAVVLLLDPLLVRPNADFGEIDSAVFSMKLLFALAPVRMAASEPCTAGRRPTGACAHSGRIRNCSSGITNSCSSIATK
jgi:hypothetical protein